jgi:antibiotic biosynthesis monooxygenase (ABM) superfamily enzyme
VGKEGPVVIALFGGVVVKAGMEKREAELSGKLRGILRGMPGFISYKSYQADDSEWVDIIRFDSRETLEAWAREGVHGAAQKVAHEYFERFWVQTSETYREYTWTDGTRADGDLTQLFAER